MAVALLLGAAEAVFRIVTCRGYRWVTAQHAREVWTTHGRVSQLHCEWCGRDLAVFIHGDR